MIIGGDDSDEIDYCGRFGNGGGLTQLTGRCWTLWRRWIWKPMNGECRQRVFWISTTLPLLPLSCSFTKTTTKNNCHWFQLFRRKRWESQEKIMHASPQGEDLRRQKIVNCVFNDDWWFTSAVVKNQAGSNHDGRVGHTFACNFWKSFPDKSVHEAKYFQPLSKFYILLSIPNTYFHSSLMFPAAPPVLYIEKSKSKSN